ncbi:MAG TPA: DoxX family protein [Gaiellaceae bacterium]
MSSGLLLLRIVIGLTLFGHGAQKLFGWWGGPGQAGTRGWLGSMGFRMPAVMAFLLGISEASGLLLALGLLTPLAALLTTSAMLVAIGSVHWKNGFWSSKGGYEFNLALIAGSVAIAATGPGRYSLDHAFGWDDNLSGHWWGAGVVLVAVATAAFILTALRGAPPPQETAA